MIQNLNAEELEAKKKAQERVTKPLHPRDVPLFLRDSAKAQKPDANDKPDAKRE